MANVLSIAGSPSRISRTTAVLRHVDGLLADRGHEVVPIEARALPAEALLRADTFDPAVTEVIALVEWADAVVVGTPVYKAAYSGLLKALLDLLPQHALQGKAALPLATGGTTAHMLAIDYALRPVLASLGAAHIAPGRFMIDKDIELSPTAGIVLTEEPAQALRRLAAGFSDDLDARTTAVTL